MAAWPGRLEGAGWGLPQGRGSLEQGIQLAAASPQQAMARTWAQVGAAARAGAVTCAAAVTWAGECL
jgi:hypothetical protein